MGGTSRLGMLLGPEDTGHSHPVGVVGCVSSGGRLLPAGALCVHWLGLVGGLLENCTVDASIFDLLWSSF